MANAEADDRRKLPSVDEVLRTETARLAAERFGRPGVVEAVRAALAAARAGHGVQLRAEQAAAIALGQLEATASARLRPVYNLTGTVLHTNLGRALLAEQAIEAATSAMRNAVALEFDLETGRRGERDDLLRGLLRELTGAEDATVVNNNAAAVLLVLNTLSKGKEAIVSRGELIEIGGAFRLPQIMNRAGARLVEVGTTNRTHTHDYADAIGARTALILKVHRSNYRIEGFAAEVSARALATIARERKIPLVNDLGSGTLADLERFGLPYEPTVAEAVADGADLVTFSGDKLLGGPQAGFIVGRSDLIAKINRNPLKRTLRVDKIRLAAIEATLSLYRDPDRLARRLPTLRLLARTQEEIKAIALRMAPIVAARVGHGYDVEPVACASEVGSGALPVQGMASAGVAIRPLHARRSGDALGSLAAALRRLPVPVIGRIEKGALILDLRCLEDEAAFVANLAHLEVAGADGAGPTPKAGP
jgi:L-seryl-tRNA(Ser) seleniumtransferase